MIRVHFFNQSLYPIPIDGIRDMLRLFYGAAKMEMLPEGGISYATETELQLICGFTEQYAFATELTSLGNTTNPSGLDKLLNAVQKGQVRIPIHADDSVKIVKRKLKRCIYNYLAKLNGFSFPWGSLSGIRPTFLADEALKEGLNPAETLTYLQEQYALKPGKAALAVEVALAEQNIIAQQDPQGLHLYVHVPFCRTRCSYCSFTNQADINPDEAKLESYLEALLLELDTGLHGLRRKVNSIYFGGGSPAIFSPEQLQRLFTCVNKHVELKECPELSFEAGRSDDLDLDKLTILKESGVTRLCINPQSMQKETLIRINRPADVQSVVKVFHMARDLGFDNINMDLIAGLADETLADFAESVQQVSVLQPESITVHSLAKKRKSDFDLLLREAALLNKPVSHFSQKRSDYNDAGKLEQQLGRLNPELESMLDFAESQLKKQEYRPYYLYRQKDGLGGLENVGYAKEGFACIYNVCMMADAQSIMAFGAAAISKLVLSDKVKRLANVANVTQYINRVSEMAETKRAFFHSYFI